MEILDKLRAQAGQNPHHIVLFEGEEDRTLAAAAEIERDGIARLTLLGDPDKIRARAQEAGPENRGQPDRQSCYKPESERLRARTP